jgi:23S rRNA pseudouridine1911/1915/1917 synthase
VASPASDPRRLAAARDRLAARGVDVLVEDHMVLGIAKAAGVLSQPGPTGETSLVELLGAYRQESEAKEGLGFVGLVHRLDRNVSGAMVVAKSSKAASRLSAAFRTREGVEKTYVAWVGGVPASGGARLRSVLVRDVVRRVTHATPVEDGDDEGDVATLDYEVEASGDGVSRLRVRLHTGGTHQIRAQLAREGLPIVGDAKYGGAPAPRGVALGRPALHARRLVVPHPSGSGPVVLEAPLPMDVVTLDAPTVRGRETR